jgi:hypothetical protein
MSEREILTTESVRPSLITRIRRQRGPAVPFCCKTIT